MKLLPSRFEEEVDTGTYFYCLFETKKPENEAVFSKRQGMIEERVIKTFDELEAIKETLPIQFLNDYFVADYTLPENVEKAFFEMTKYANVGIFDCRYNMPKLFGSDFPKCAWIAVSFAMYIQFDFIKKLSTTRIDRFTIWGKEHEWSVCIAY